MSRGLLRKAFERFPWLHDEIEDVKEFGFESACTRSASCRAFDNSLGNHLGPCTQRILPQQQQSGYVHCRMNKGRDCRRARRHLGQHDSYAPMTHMTQQPCRASLTTSYTCMYARFPGVSCSRRIKHPDGSLEWKTDCLLPAAHLGNCTDISFTHSLPHHMCHPHYRWQIWKEWNVGWVVCDRPGGMRVHSHRTCSAYMFVVGHAVNIALLHRHSMRISGVSSGAS